MTVTHPFAHRPIPMIENPPTTSKMKIIPIDLTDSRFSDPLVDLQALGLRGQNYYARGDGGNEPYFVRIEGSIEQLLIRSKLGEMLIKVEQNLSQYGLALWIYDGYRPIKTQKGLWSFFRAQLAGEYPALSDSELDEKTRTFLSDPSYFDPDDQKTWPLHSTGSAVDLVLTLKGSETQLDFGTPFDDMTDASRTDYFEHQLSAGQISETDERLVNRRILYWAMSEQGFTNYLHEYWHFDYGNQMHVLTLKTLGLPTPPAAWYGYTPLSNDD